MEPQASKSNILGNLMSDLNIINNGLQQTEVDCCKGGDRRQHKLKQRFTVIRKLGKGTYGKVQLGINKDTGQEVAIKTIKKAKIETEQDLQRVRREIQIMSSIEHPHIIHIYEVFENKDKIVLVMQYAPGGELYEHVSRAKVLDDNEARRLFRQIATAIFYCHQNKICHRDLKLENILLDEKNNAKLADFGLSNVFDSNRQLRTFCGSPLYASPEIVQGSPYIGPEVDCWSLGVLLYTLVYGAMPFDGSNFKRLVSQISEASFFEPKRKSAASGLIRKLLCADPSKRATIIDICNDPWVNGIALRRSPSFVDLHEHQQQPQHNSLIKVAQDMANLTPVRFDLLVTLAPSSPPVVQQTEQLTPSESLEIYEQPNLPPQAPDNNEENQAVSNNSIKEEFSKMNADFFATVETTQSILETPEETEMLIENANVEAKMVQTQQEELREIGDDKNELGKEVLNVEEREQVKEQQHKLDTESLLLGAKELAISEANDKTIAELPQEQPATSLCSETRDELNVPQTQTELSSETQTPTPEPIKPKTKRVVKKKVIVVKKKKKTSDEEKDKKSAETQLEAQPQPQTPQQQHQQQRRRSSVAIGRSEALNQPGKMRIPDSFICKSIESGEQTQAHEKRRVSVERATLIVDVANKLLAQQNATTQVPRTQVPVLPAKVSAAKSAFERRASLAAGGASSGNVSQRASPSHGSNESLANGQPNNGDEKNKIVTVASNEQTREIKRCENDEIQRELAKYVESLEKLRDAAEKMDEEDKKAPSSDESEQPTPEVAPTFSSKLQINLSATQEPTDSAIELSQFKEPPRPAQLAKPRQPQWPMLPVAERLVRPASKERDSVSARGSTDNFVTAPLPAPITRSYKKVTFTRDGACVTETGKIYTRNQVDGTVCRIERKSKVTHFPAADGSGARQHEEIVEEVVQAGEAIHAQQAANYALSPQSSNSSNSSSGDIFDDIFDSWTGATNMFVPAGDKGDREDIASAHRKLLESSLGARGSLFGTLGRRGKRSAASRNCAPVASASHSAAPQTRGESLEPHRRRRNMHQLLAWPAPFDNSPFADFQSLASADPLSAVADDWLESDPFFDSASRRLEQEAARMRRQFEQPLQSRAWKGSTPSLFSSGFGAPSDEPSVAQTRSRPRALWQFMGAVPCAGEQSSQTPEAGGPKQQLKTSTSFDCQSIALDTAPRQRNTAQLPSDQLVQCSTSRQSLIEHFSEMSVGSRHAGESQSSLRRATESFWDVCATPDLSASNQSQASSPDSNACTQSSAAQTRLSNSASNDNCEQRVQHWLKDSDLTNSAGLAINSSLCSSSQSNFLSQSFARNTYAEQLPPAGADGGGGGTSRLPPPSPTPYSLRNSISPARAKQFPPAPQQQVGVFRSTSSCSSSSKLRLDIAGANIATKRQATTTSSQEFMCADRELASVCSSASILLEHRTLADGHSVERQQSRNLITRIISTASHQPVASHDEEPRGGSADSVSGGSSGAELSASASLLEQLRTRGYRTMINQRLAGLQEEEPVEKLSEHSPKGKSRNTSLRLPSL